MGAIFTADAVGGSSGGGATEATALDQLADLDALAALITAGKLAVIDTTTGTKLDAINTALGHLTDGTLLGQVSGTVAAAAADSGNPVKVGAKYNATKPTYTDGQRGDAQIGTRGSLLVTLTADNSSVAMVSAADNADALATTSNLSLLRVIAESAAFNGSTWDRRRTPNTFKAANATASGNTTIWTPASGKKFRLMGYVLDVPSDCTTAGGAEIAMVFYDGASTSTLIGHRIYVPAAGGTALGGWSSGYVALGNGYLSAAANNVLNLNLGAALSAGTCRVTVFGTEE